MTTLPISEIKAFAKLLKSKDDSIENLLEEQIKTFDNELLQLVNSEIPLDDTELKSRFIRLVSNVKREKTKEEFVNWSNNKQSSLEDGIFLIASVNNPLMDIGYYKNLLNDWARQLLKNIEDVKLQEDTSSIINEVNHFLFMELGFKGNKKNYYDVENSYIDRVIDKKIGNPILLSTIYLLVTNRMSLPFKGVNMPAHFIVQYLDEIEPIYVDPFNQGEIITKDICRERIKNLNLAWSDAFLATPTNKQVLIRVVQNLINIYQDQGESEKQEYFESIIKILKN